MITAFVWLKENSTHKIQNMNTTSLEDLNSTTRHTSINDVADLRTKLIGFVINAVQPTIGLAVLIVNTALLFFYKHGAKASKITLLFLRNLTCSDILFGFIFIVRFGVITAAPQYTTVVCRFVLGPMNVASVTGTAWSMVLISIQVRYEVKFSRRKGL